MKKFKDFINLNFSVYNFEENSPVSLMQSPTYNSGFCNFYPGTFPRCIIPTGCPDLYTFWYQQYLMVGILLDIFNNWNFINLLVRVDPAGVMKIYLPARSLRRFCGALVFFSFGRGGHSETPMYSNQKFRIPRIFGGVFLLHPRSLTGKAPEKWCLED